MAQYTIKFGKTTTNGNGRKTDSTYTKEVEARSQAHAEAMAHKMAQAASNDDGWTDTFVFVISVTAN